MLLSHRAVFVFLAFCAAGLLATGLALGEWLRLQPCYLCNFQRLLYLVLAGFSLLGVLWPRYVRTWSACLALTAVGGVLTALQQSWMQYVPQQVVECGFSDPTIVEQIVDWLGVRWPSMFMVTGFCTQKDWVFLGLSLANWSVFCFLGFLAAAVWLAFKSKGNLRGASGWTHHRGLFR